MCSADSRFLCAASDVELIFYKCLAGGKLDVCVWPVVLMFVFVEDCDLYGHKDAFLLSGGDPADFLLHVEPCQRIRFI